MGKSENEIYDFLSEKYGDWILYKPKLNKIKFFIMDNTLYRTNFWCNTDILSSI